MKKSLNELLVSGIEIENFFGVPQDIEWAIECEKLNEETNIPPYLYSPVTTCNNSHR